MLLFLSRAFWRVLLAGQVGRFGANAAWLGLNVIAHNLSGWTVRIGGLDKTPTAKAAAPDAREATADSRCEQPAGRNRKSFVATETLRRCYLATPGRLARSHACPDPTGT